MVGFLSDCIRLAVKVIQAGSLSQFVEARSAMYFSLSRKCVCYGAEEDGVRQAALKGLSNNLRLALTVVTSFTSF